ncbi:MAG: hypothetical protein HRU35_00550 [Rickettsiaceae bacterium]|nr:hypothetical protein [Rickettsiaceae bacterium]
MAGKNTVNFINKKKSSSKLFNDLADTIKEAYNNDKTLSDKIDDAESRILARNMIEFCQKFIEIQIRIESEAEKIMIKQE